MLNPALWCLSCTCVAWPTLIAQVPDFWVHQNAWWGLSVCCSCVHWLLAQLLLQSCLHLAESLMKFHDVTHPFSRKIYWIVQPFLRSEFCLMSFSGIINIWGEIFCKGGWGRHVIWSDKEVLLTDRLLHSCTHFTIVPSGADTYDANLCWRLVSLSAWGTLLDMFLLTLMTFLSSPLFCTCSWWGIETKLVSITFNISWDSKLETWEWSWTLCITLVAASGTCASLHW